MPWESWSLGERRKQEKSQSQQIWQKRDYGDIGDDGDVLGVLLAFQGGLALASLDSNS